MTDWVEELNERSKDDNAIIVGSEVRALVAEVDRLGRVSFEESQRAARLEREVERLKVWNASANEHLRLMAERAVAAESRAARLEERLGVVRGVLKSVEWGGYDELRGSGCPKCDGGKTHAPGCALAAALGE